MSKLNSVQGGLGSLALAAGGVVTLMLSVTAQAAGLPKCLFVSSYHQGYAWSDGVERGLRQTLDGKCEVQQFDMDTKRRKEQSDKEQAALRAKDMIESWQPDIVIVADDNAARYLVQPFYKDAKLPFVFCGINWTVEDYGFPYSNVTGMIEVAPVKAMIEEANALVPRASRVMYLGADTKTEKKNAARIRRSAERQGLVFEPRFVHEQGDWIAAYEDGQDYDYIIVGSNAGINGWDNAQVFETIEPMSTRLTVTNHEWMMPVSMLGMTKVPEEQGEWAGQVALQILSGIQADRIPVVTNRKWELFVNPRLTQAAKLELPEQLLSKGKVFR